MNTFGKVKRLAVGALLALFLALGFAGGIGGSEAFAAGPVAVENDGVNDPSV